MSRDDRLARRAAQGDERAFAAIYERYHQGLYRFCLTIVGNRQDAQDALQNTMVKVLRALPGEKRSIRLKPWLYRIAHNEAVELLRRRRDNVGLEPELVSGGNDPAETAATRERLQRLFADLVALPERQRAALTMRELAGLGFAEIGAALETSDAVARQTVYEARLGLRRMEAGREMSCKKVMWELSEKDGRVARRRDIQAHLRACPECRAFRDEIKERRHDLGALAPLPLVASTGLLQGLLAGGGTGGAAAGGAGAAVSGTGITAGTSGGLAGATAAGAGKVVATSAVVKSAATVAVVAAVGVATADRGGLIETPLPAEIGGAKSSGPATGAGETPSSAQPDRGAVPAENSNSSGTPIGGRDVPKGSTPAEPANGENDPASKSKGVIPESGRGQGNGGVPPAAAGHGRQTAAAHSQGKSKGAKANGPPPKGGGKAAAETSPKGDSSRGSQAGGVGSGGRSGSAPSKESPAKTPTPHPAQAKQTPPSHPPAGMTEQKAPAKGSPPKG